MRNLAEKILIQSILHQVIQGSLTQKSQYEHLKIKVQGDDKLDDNPALSIYGEMGM